MGFENGRQNIGRKAIGTETRKTGKEIDSDMKR